MVVDAGVSQLSPQWSTLLLSSSTASGLRHHQQHRSMTSQPRPSPCRPAWQHRAERLAAWTPKKHAKSSFYDRLQTPLSSIRSNSSSWRSECHPGEVQAQIWFPSTKKKQRYIPKIKTQTLVFLITALKGPSSRPLCLRPLHSVLSCPMLLPLSSCSAALRVPADIYRSGEDAAEARGAQRGRTERVGVRW